LASRRTSASSRESQCGVGGDGNQQVFAKRGPNGDTIVGLFNTGGKAEEVSVPAATVGLPVNESGYSLHDLWTGETKTTSSTISAVVASHGVVYRVRVL